MNPKFGARLWVYPNINLMKLRNVQCHSTTNFCIFLCEVAFASMRHEHIPRVNPSAELKIDHSLGE
jgi:hypothetical protein